MMKKFLVILFLCLALIMVSCQANETIGEKNIKGFLQELYQVENTEEYQKLMESTDRYFQEKRILNPEAKILTMDKEAGAEISKSYISKYKQYCSDRALKLLFQNGYAIKYDQQAYEEQCQFYVKGISLEQDKRSKTQYYYTVQVEQRLKDGTVQLKSGQGIIRLNDEGYIYLFKMIQQLKGQKNATRA